MHMPLIVRLLFRVDGDICAAVLELSASIIESTEVANQATVTAEVLLKPALAVWPLLPLNRDPFLMRLPCKLYDSQTIP